MIARLIIKSMIILIVTPFCGCTLMEDSSISIVVPFYLYKQEANSGDQIIYPIEITAYNAALNYAEIVSSNTVDGEVSLYNEPIEPLQSQLYIDFTFSAPEYAEESVPTILRIMAADELNNYEQLSLAVTVYGGENIPLVDIPSVELYSAASGGNNAYSFATSEWINYIDADPTTVDIYDYPTTIEEDEDGDELLESGDDPDTDTDPDPDTDTDTDTDTDLDTDTDIDPETTPDTELPTDESPSREWHSMTGKLFARLTGFNNSYYDYATISSVKYWFNVAIKLESMSDIEVGDVIFVGSDSETPIAIIRVEDIVDMEGVEQDHYLISMKRTYLEVEEEEEEGEDDLDPNIDPDPDPDPDTTPDPDPTQSDL